MNQRCGWMVLMGQGSAWSWGLNDLGQLGDNTTAERRCPRAGAGSQRRRRRRRWGLAHGVDVGVERLWSTRPRAGLLWYLD
jgi:hypothetical protein